MPAPDLAYREKIAKLYRIALYCYAAPFAFLALSSVFDLFVPFFLLGFFVFGSAGAGCTAAGLRRAFKNHDPEKKDIGYANLLLGTILVLAGTLILAFAYVRVNE